MHRTGNEQRIGDSEALWNRIQAGTTVVVDVLTGIKYIKAANPERDRGTKKQHAAIERAGYSDPSGGRRNPESEPQENVRPVREALCERVEKEDGDGQRSELQSERVQPPGGDEEESYGGEREKPGELDREGAGRQRALLRSGIFAVVTKVGDAVHGHGRGARRNHRDDNPYELAQRRPTTRRLVSGARGKKGPGKRERKSKDGMLELNHFEHGANAAGHRNLCLRLFHIRLARPAIHIFLRKIDLCQNSANILNDQVVDRLWMMIEGRDRRHDHRSRLLRAKHVLQVNAVEGRVADAEDEFPVFL